MADIADLGRLRVTVKNRPELTPHFTYDHVVQVMTAARRGETLALRWKYVDFAASATARSTASTAVARC